MSFECLLWIQVRWRGGGGSFSRKTYLPFPPYPGLEIWLPEFGAGREGECLKRVVWIAGEDHFFCEVTPDSTDTNERREVVRDYLGEGWALDDEWPLAPPAG